MSSQRGQIFILGLVIIALSLFVVFSIFITVQETSVVLFDSSSSTMVLENFVNAAAEKNAWLADDWHFANRLVRQPVSITNTDGVWGGQIDLAVTFTGCTGNCLGQIVVTDTNGSFASYSIVGSGSSGTVQIVELPFWAGATTDYLFYYNDTGLTSISITSPPTPPFFTLSYGPEETMAHDGLCTEANDFYNTLNVDFDCSYSKNASWNSAINHTITFRAPDLEFEGMILR